MLRDLRYRCNTGSPRERTVFESEKMSLKGRCKSKRSYVEYLSITEVEELKSMMLCIENDSK